MQAVWKDQRETEPGAARGAAVPPHEALDDALAVRRRDARSVVAYGEPPLVVIGVQDHAHLGRALCGAAMGDRVADQVVGEYAHTFRPRADRERIREILPSGEFIEVFIDCPIEECERRDVKGLYKKARAGEIPEFTGISAPYEAPESAEVVLKTAEDTVETCAAQAIAHLERAGVLR